MLLAPVGLVVLIPALWVLSSFNATPLHPAPVSVPAVTNLAAPPKWAAAVERARQVVRAAVAAQNLPGVSVAAGIGGEIVWAEGFGFADLRTSTPVTAAHRFRIGTVSTLLASAAAGLLLEQGRLNLDDDIQKYVPAWAREQQPVTLRELMGHTRGVTPDDGDEAPLHRRHCERPAQAVEHFKNWLYGDDRNSIYDWILVSAAIEAAAGQPFFAFMQERIFDPLQMRDTAADPGPTAAEVEGEDFPGFILIRELIYDPGAARGPANSSQQLEGGEVTAYSTRFRSDPKYGVHVARLADYSCYAGSAGFLSTPSDLVRFAMAINSGKLLQPATVQLLETSQQLDSGEETGYGLGWDLEALTLAGTPAVAAGHNGDLPGGRVASLWTFPGHGLAVAVASNVEHADTFSLAMKIAEAFAEQMK
jgi:serine beta-lactamase-like protein LACTB